MAVPVIPDADLIALPKADLHVHLIGSAAPATVVALAACHPGGGVPVTLDGLREFCQIRQLARASIESSFAPPALRQRLAGGRQDGSTMTAALAQ